MTKRKVTKKKVKKVRDEFGLEKERLADLVAERDALAARVIELEKQASEFQPCTRSHGEGVK